MIKRRLLLSLVGLAITVIIPAASWTVVHADSVNIFPNGCSADICKDNSAGAKDNPLFGPKGVMTEIIHLLAIFVGIIAVISIIISGFMMITAAGDASKVSNARRALLYAIIGLVIASMAQLIVTFVLDKIAT